MPTILIQSGVSHQNQQGGAPIYDHYVNTDTGQHYWVQNEELAAMNQATQEHEANQIGYGGNPEGFGQSNYFEGFSGVNIDVDTSLITSTWSETGESAQRALTSMGAIQSQGASGAVGNRQELQRMLESYKGRKSLIQSAQRQKAIYTIDRFDGGLNLNKSPRDLADWEACSLNELTPSKIGRLVRLGDFTATTALSGFMADDSAVVENYGLFYFSLSNEKDLGATGATTNYIAINDENDINVWDLSDGSLKANIIASLDTSHKPVYHSADNRLYVSDANLKNNGDATVDAVEISRVAGIIDRPKLYPYTSGSSVSYNISGTTASSWFIDTPLYHIAPVKGNGAGQITVVGTQSASTAETGISNAAGGHHGIYMNIQFANVTEDISGTGWGGIDTETASKYYYIYASFLYDNGSETKLTAVSDDDAGGDGDSASAGTIVATTTSDSEYQKMVIKQIYIDATEFRTNFPRVHGARFYYTEASGNDLGEIGDDKYLFAELDFRYGFKLISEFGNWNNFLQITGSDGGSIDATSIQVKNAANTANDTAPDGTLSIPSPPTAFTYYSQNLFHQEELKEDLMWKTSTMGNGIAFIGNIKYDNTPYSGTMIYSGAGETDSGSAYPMWGTFPVDSNRVDIPGAAGEITALKWINNKVLQFRTNSMYLIDVKDVLSPSVDGVYQGMGISGQYAVTETPFGVAWVNGSGAYAYNTQDNLVKSLTIGRLDDEDFGADSTTKIGYDDRSKLLIIGNHTRRATDGYHYAYSFITDSWCTWDTNANSNTPISNFAIDSSGYLTGATEDGTALDIHKWNTIAQSAVAVEYITKDIDFGKPNLDKRLYTLYISYTGGASQSAMNVYFRVNGKEGADLANGWYQLETLQDYTDPYFTTESSAWNDSDGTPVTGDPTINLDTGLNSTSTGEVQKLAKINLRNLGSTDTVDDTDTSVSTFPKDYLKFARSIQFKIAGTASVAFEINDISLVYKEKRIK